MVLRKFNNPDAMVAALKSGELDAAEDVPGSSFNQLAKDPDFVAVQGYQGAMTELGINGGDGLKKPHPALLDPEVRKAIGHAIDKQTIVNRVLDGLGKPLETLSVSPNPAWTPEIPEADRFDFDLDKAKQILEDAGYKDTERRRRPRDAERRRAAQLPLRRAHRQRGRATDRRVHHRLAQGDRHRDHAQGLRRQRADGRDRQGRLRPVRVGLGAVRRPGPDAVVLHTATRSRATPKDPTNYYNDANYCDPAYDKLYAAAEGGARRRRSASRSSTRCSRAFSSGACTTRCTCIRTLQVYRKGRFEGFVRQPAKTGPVYYSNTSPSYALMKPVSGSASGDDGGGSAGIIAIIVLAALALVGGLVWARRRRTADERE